MRIFGRLVVGFGRLMVGILGVFGVVICVYNIFVAKQVAQALLPFALSLLFCYVAVSGNLRALYLGRGKLPPFRPK